MEKKSEQFQDRILRLPEVERITGMSKPTIYRKMEHNAFPKARKLGDGRAVGWLLSTINTWLADLEVA